MRFTWNEKKRRLNLRNHRLDFGDAPAVFAGSTFSFEDVRFEYGERRWITLGLLGLTVVVIAHTESEEVIHVISVRKATREEQALFFANL